MNSGASPASLHANPAKGRTGSPSTPGTTRNTDPASSSGSNGSPIMSREVVMYSSSRSAPPNVHAVTCEAGSSTTSVNEPSGA